MTICSQPDDAIVFEDENDSTDFPGGEPIDSLVTRLRNAERQLSECTYIFNQQIKTYEIQIQYLRRHIHNLEEKYGVPLILESPTYFAKNLDMTNAIELSKNPLFHE